VARRRIAVVGAGLAGLSAALELKASGAEVELFERSRLLGGRATSFEIDGHEVDNGQHVFLNCCTEFVGFVERVGMAQHLRVQERFDALVLSRDGVAGRLRAGAFPAPFHLLFSFTHYRHLGARGKLRVARALVAAMRHHNNGERSTFAEWLQTNGQDAETLRAFWDPFFIPALNAPFDCVATNDAMFVLATAFLKDAGAARFGFSTVPLAHVAAAAARQLDAVHLSTPVLGVEIRNSGPESRSVVLSLSRDDTAEFDAVVLAVPPRQTAKILGDPQRFGVRDLEAYTAFPIIDVHLWHDRGALDFDFAALLDSPVQWIFEKEPGYLCCSMSAAQEQQRMTTAELTQQCWSDVRTALPALSDATLVCSSVTRNPEATYLPAPGTRRTAQRTSEPAVAIAGSWTDTGWPDTMESAVRSGIAAAKALLSPGALSSRV
jgi:squalene-associated FAD-dependent desaturase